MQQRIEQIATRHQQHSENKPTSLTLERITEIYEKVDQFCLKEYKFSCYAGTKHSADPVAVVSFVSELPGKRKCELKEKRNSFDQTCYDCSGFLEPVDFRNKEGYLVDGAHSLYIELRKALEDY